MLNTVKKSQDLYKNRPWLPFLVLVIFGTMVLAVCSILPGCGSDGTPGASVKGKNDNAATGSKVPKMQGAIPLLTDTQGNGGRLGSLKKSPEVQRVEIFPGITQDELDAKKAAHDKKLKEPGLEIFPGITREQMDAKLQAHRKQVLDPDIEIFPGITQEQLNAKFAAQRVQVLSQINQMFPGITSEQLNAKIAAPREKVPAPANQMVPGPPKSN